MPRQQPLVILTRPADQARRFQKVLSGLDVMIAPILEIRHLPVDTDPARFSHIVLASGNAVSAAGFLGLEGRKAIAVGKATARAAQAAGMSAVAAEGDADSLVKTVIAQNPAGPVLFLRGRHSRGDVARRIAAAGIPVEEFIVYDQRALPLPDKAIRAFRGERRLAIPLFSPRSAALLGKQLQSHRDELKNGGAPFCLIAMSRKVLQAWEGPEPQATRVAGSPDAAAMAHEIMACVQNWP